MRELPIQCRARHEAIRKIAKEFLESWINGNKNTVRDELLDMEPLAALAVLSKMMHSSDSEVRAYITSYFMEVA